MWDTAHASDRSPMLTSWSRSLRTFVPDLYYLGHVAWWEAYYLHDTAYVSWNGSVLCRLWTTSHSGRRGNFDDLDHGLCDLSVGGVVPCVCALAQGLKAKKTGLVASVLTAVRANVFLLLLWNRCAEQERSRSVHGEQTGGARAAAKAAIWGAMSWRRCVFR